jgi:hypothetical protein
VFQAGPPDVGPNQGGYNGQGTQHGWGGENASTIFAWRLEGKRLLEDIDLYGRIILKQVL